MKRFRIAALTVVLCTLTGCKQADPHPEQSDPIFRDLEARATTHAKANEEATLKVTQLAESLLKAEPNSLDKKDLENQLAKARINLRESGQWARYYKIRSARRKIEDAISYAKAFAADQPWPPKEEFAEYQVNRHLVESDRNWNKRVPKAKGRVPSSKSEANGEEKPKAEHGTPAPPAGHE